MTSIRLVLATFILLMPACSSHVTKALPRASIQQTTQSMKEAFRDQNAADVYSCLSQDLKDREGLSLGRLDVFFGEVESRVKALVGDIESIEIEDIDKVDDRTAWVTYRSATRTAQVRFRLETVYEIVPASENDDGDYGILPSLDTAMTIDEDGVTLRLPSTDLEVDAEGIYEISVINAWLVDALDARTLEEASP